MQKHVKMVTFKVRNYFRERTEHPARVLFLRHHVHSYKLWDPGGFFAVPSTIIYSAYKSGCAQLKYLLSYIRVQTVKITNYYERKYLGFFYAFSLRSERTMET